jgi:hypothetical protein
MLSYGELGCQLPIFLYNSRREAFMEISLHKTEKGLKELHRKLAEEQKLRERQAAIEDSLCELDAAVNK